MRREHFLHHVAVLHEADAVGEGEEEHEDEGQVRVVGEQDAERAHDPGREHDDERRQLAAAHALPHHPVGEVTARDRAGDAGDGRDPPDMDAGGDGRQLEDADEICRQPREPADRQDAETDIAADDEQKAGQIRCKCARNVTSPAAARSCARRGGSRTVPIRSARVRVMSPTTMKAACQSEVAPINGTVHGLDAAERRQDRAADEIGAGRCRRSRRCRTRRPRRRAAISGNSRR